MERATIFKIDHNGFSVCAPEIAPFSGKSRAVTQVQHPRFMVRQPRCLRSKPRCAAEPSMGSDLIGDLPFDPPGADKIGQVERRSRHPRIRQTESSH